MCYRMGWAETDLKDNLIPTACQEEVMQLLGQKGYVPSVTGGMHSCLQPRNLPIKALTQCSSHLSYFEHSSLLAITTILFCLDLSARLSSNTTNLWYKPLCQCSDCLLLLIVDKQVIRSTNLKLFRLLCSASGH